MSVPAIVARLAYEARPALSLEHVDGNTAARLGEWIGADPAAYAVLVAIVKAVAVHADERRPPMIVEPPAPQEIPTAHGPLFAFLDGCPGCDVANTLLAAERWAVGADGRCHVWRRVATTALCGALASTPPSVHPLAECEEGEHIACQRCGAMTWTLAHCGASA